MNNHECAYTFVYTIGGNKLVMTEVEGTEDYENSSSWPVNHSHEQERH